MKSHLTCLGIEGTAHTFGAAVVNSKGNILSDARDMYKSESHGIIPSECAMHHKNIKDRIIKEALTASKSEKIGLVAFSAAPGLAPCLRVAKDAAIEIAKDLNVPVIGVNHSIAHLTSGLLYTEAKDPIYLYLSGANTQIIALINKRFRIFGEAIDTPLGNALDKFGREAGLGFPAGPKIEELAKKGSYITLPYAVKGMDLSFAGLVTMAINLLKKGVSKEDICYSFQETSFSMVAEVTERALAHTRKNEVLLIGGVAANKRLSEMLTIMCNERKAKFFAVPLKYAGDNAVMIAWQGILEHQAGRTDEVPDIRPYERTDQVEVFW